MGGGVPDHLREMAPRLEAVCWVRLTVVARERGHLSVVPHARDSVSNLVSGDTGSKVLTVTVEAACVLAEVSIVAPVASLSQLLSSIGETV